jgi:putative nucleotidyltransferase with HDIG domain
MTDTKEILRAVKKLPTLSVSFSRVMAVADDPHADAARLEAVIRPDPSLTANLLRITNSAYYGCPRRVDTVRQAVTMLGTSKVVNAAVAAGFFAVIPEGIPGYGMTSGTYWKHCAAVAVLAASICAETGMGKADAAFTAGLLHDIGKLVTGAFLAKDAARVLRKLREDGVSLDEAEGQVLGMDHTQVGAEVAEAWNLPVAICQVVRWHHAPAAAPAGEILVDVVHAADCLAHAMGMGEDIGEMSRSVAPEAIARVGTGRRELERIASESLGQIEELMALYSCDVGGE